MSDSAVGAAGSALRRDLGLLDAVGIGFGAIVGAGIFVVTGVAAGVAGPAFLLGLLIAGAAATANAFSSAQLAAEYPVAGGTYEYGYRVLSPALGFTAGWAFLASKIAAAGTVALGLAGYTSALLPGLPPRAVSVGAVVAFTVLNWFGVRRSSRVNLLIVGVSLGSLLLFVALGVGSFRSSNLRPFAPAGWLGVLRSAALLFFAYTGYARIATLGEEVKEPRTTIPRAIEITIWGAILLYGAVALVGVGAVGADALAATPAPLADAARSFQLGGVSTVVAVGGVTAMLGVILSQLLGLSRMTFAMARRGDLPRFLEEVHPTHRVPGKAVLVIGLVTAVVAATGALSEVAAAASFTILVYYGIANLAALRLPREAKLFSDAVPRFGLVSCTLLALSLEPTTILTGLVILAFGFVLRWFVRIGALKGSRGHGGLERPSGRIEDRNRSVHRKEQAAGAGHMTELTIGGVTIELLVGDIARQEGFDAVVNAANAELRSGGGVAGALHRAAGPGLEQEATRFAPIRPGEAVITSAHRLPNRYVIHCLGPVYGRDNPSDERLASCYREALLLAEKNGVRSVAFPAISTGVFGYPAEEAARVALRAIAEQAARLGTVRRVRLVLHDERALAVHAAALQAFATEERTQQ